MRSVNKELAPPWGTRLKEARLAQGLTQTELALRLDVAQSTIVRWENGGTIPLVILPALTRELGLTWSDLDPEATAS